MILLKNATFIDWQSLNFTHADILVRNGVKGDIEFINESSYKESEKSTLQIIDCTGKIVTKSFAIGHHHIYSALGRGMPAPKKSPENFFEKLKYIWWAVDKQLDKDMIEASALVTAMYSAKAGNTFVIDHHSSPNYIKGSLELIKSAFERVGVNHLLCYEITDRNGKKKTLEGLEETDSYLQNNQGLVGLHASFTVGNETMQKAVDLMQKHQSGIHIHVAEDRYDEDHSLIHFEKRVVERLNDYGVLDSSKTILGHCLHLSENERQILGNSKAWVVQNTESNLNNKVGHFFSRGLSSNILLGTDGMHSDMIRSAQQTFFHGQTHDSINYSTIYDRLRNVHRYLNNNNFEGDGDNNLVVLDYKPPGPINKENFLAHFLFGFSKEDILHVISKGELIVENKQLSKIDEEKIFTFSNEQSLRLWEKLRLS
jgi:cytosine/adenosine deaminase-related metal-dependent hydrolase